MGMDRRREWIVRVVVVLAMLTGLAVVLGRSPADVRTLRATGVWDGLPTLEGIDGQAPHGAGGR